MDDQITDQTSQPPREPPTIVIVGRPNVGKSTLFNRLIGMRRAIVGDEPGITRDRLYGTGEWRGRKFRITDTGGIIPDENETIPANIFRQARAAIDEAALVILLVDARAGVTPADEELARLIRLINKPVFVAANKVDVPKVEAHALEFERLGFDVFPVSAEHGGGIGEMLDAAFEVIDRTSDLEPLYISAGDSAEQEKEIKIAIMGRPNVGKSSLANRLIGEERVIVSPIPGTTRDAIDTEIVRDGLRFRLIDTAGIRRKGKTQLMAEKLSVIMARRHLERADVAILLMDAVEGPAALDATIGGYVHEAGVGLIIAVNKWDAVEKDTHTTLAYERRIRELMKFADYAPIVFISAKTGQRAAKLFELAERVYGERNKRVSTAELNRFFEKNLDQPRASTPSRHPLRVLYITQAAVSPPTFVLFTSSRNPRARLHFSYERYVENRLREEFGFLGTPIRIKQRAKKDR